VTSSAAVVTFTPEATTVTSSAPIVVKTEEPVTSTVIASPVVVTASPIISTVREIIIVSSVTSAQSTFVSTATQAVNNAQEKPAEGTNNTTAYAGGAAGLAALGAAAGAYMMRRGKTATAQVAETFSDNTNVNPMYEPNDQYDNPLYQAGADDELAAGA